MPGSTQINNYNKTTGFYDRLARLIFGRAIIESQNSLLHACSPGDRVLIAGGGTGELLRELCRTERGALGITFIELSEKMLARARERNAGCHEIEYVCGDAGHFRPGQSFDVIITPFLFDNFSNDKAGSVFNNLNGLLRPGGLWLYTDFHISAQTHWRYKLLLKLMYRFFKLLAKVEASRLPDTAALFAAAGYTCQEERFFYGDFIRPAIYRKSNGLRSPTGK